MEFCCRQSFSYPASCCILRLTCVHYYCSEHITTRALTFSLSQHICLPSELILINKHPSPN
ncbi:unnamed protein product, partial [Linum tenue]